MFHILSIALFKILAIKPFDAEHIPLNGHAQLRDFPIRVRVSVLQLKDRLLVERHGCWSQAMRFMVGVMGANDDFATESDMGAAYSVGQFVAKIGAVLLTGGMGGCMRAACEGAKDAGGFVLAIGPTREKGDLNDFVDVAAMTGMAGGRNYFNILSADAVVPIGVRSPGTLAEAAFSIQLERPTIVLGCTGAVRNCLSEFSSSDLRFADSVEEVFEFLTKAANDFELGGSIVGRGYGG